MENFLVYEQRDCFFDQIDEKFVMFHKQHMRIYLVVWLEEGPRGASDSLIHACMCVCVTMCMYACMHGTWP